MKSHGWRVGVEGNFCEVERAAGIEPAWPVWKTGTLPLSYTRINSDILASTLALSIVLWVD